MIALAMNVFVIEPIWKSVSGVTSSGCSMLVTPRAAISSSPSDRIADATPGTDHSSICARATSTTCSNRLTTGIYSGKRSRSAASRFSHCEPTCSIHDSACDSASGVSR